MESKLISAKGKTSTSTTVSSNTEVVKQKEVPKGAEIISSTIRTNTEEIENGFLITKSFDVRYKPPGAGKDASSEYAYYSKKWYSKVDPLTITVNDKSLAEAFNDDEDIAK